MERIVEQNLLYDFYGELLTAHQKEIYGEHILNDMTATEIAAEFGITRQAVHDMIRRCDKILADYEAVYADGEKLQAIWRGHKMAHITTPAGTDLCIGRNDIEPIIECGIARNPGDAMAWSDGEVSLGPVIDTTHGKLVIDGPICYYGCPTTPVELRIEKGRIVEVVGGDPKICKEIRRQIAFMKEKRDLIQKGTF